VALADAERGMVGGGASVLSLLLLLVAYYDYCCG
jgi:hypothetical protein